MENTTSHGIKEVHNVFYADRFHSKGKAANTWTSLLCYNIIAVQRHPSVLCTYKVDINTRTLEW